MTEQENAVKTLKFLKTQKSYLKSLDVSINAVEKQISRKPDLEGDGYADDGKIIYDTWICPNCGTHYEVDYDNYKYCPECGQRNQYR